MILAELILGGRQWLWIAAPLAIVSLAVVIWSYSRAAARSWAVPLAALLKATGIVALAVCLIEPLYSGVRPRPGSNLFLVLADNSRSLEIHDTGEPKTRADMMRASLAANSPWQTRLAQDFDVRRYAFDARLEPLKDFSELTVDGEGSSLAASLTSLADRFYGRPIAGVLVFTDGNATDLAENEIAWKNLPPIYPVVLGGKDAVKDISVSRVSVTQTNFEASPVTITAEFESQGVADRTMVVRVLDDAGKEIERRAIEKMPDEKPLVQRFQLSPEKLGISFYSIQAALEGEEQLDDSPERSAEATLANNRRMVTVDRGGGPYRVLYVSGRPNWEFKFLRRALQEDDEVNLLGLVRIAKKEPKFTFRGRAGERTNPIYRGFGNQDDEQAEQYDEPVLLRLGIEDKEELRAGFPKSPDELFPYHAIILDDIESEFFTQDEMSLMQRFVGQRGGGFLMLGGRDSFVKGKYDRTPVGEMLPVYLDRSPTTPVTSDYRLVLTREGWLQPWVRVRDTEPEEVKRLAEMPGFQTINRVSAIKPGAQILAQITSDDDSSHPALVVQRFGRGRAAALLIGDLWRWNLQRPEGTESDLEKSWRQTVRWLVADVPQRVEVEPPRKNETPGGAPRIVVRVRDEMFEPLDNAVVSIRIQTPDKHEVELAAEASQRSAGEYIAAYASRVPGAYLATVSAKAADGSEIGQREVGWSYEPATEEFRSLRPNRELLKRIAADSGGELVELNQLDSFVRSLPNRKIPEVEAWTYPLWHQWSMFLFALSCLIGEWGLRRWKGLP